MHILSSCTQGIILLLWLSSNVVSMTTYLLYYIKFSHIRICILINFLINTQMDIIYTQRSIITLNTNQFGFYGNIFLIFC